jgi:radical SAM protein with 4Fe4S-binding SPASM domain
MCPHSQNLVKNLGIADLKLARKIVNDLKEFEFGNKKPIIGLHLTGEPFVNKNILKIIKVFSEEGYFTKLNTNGILIDDVKAVIESGLSKITFSFEVYDEEIYKYFRNNNNFKKVSKTIKQFLKYKDIQVVISPLFFRHLHDKIEITKDLRKEYNGAEFYCYYASDWRGTMSDIEYLVDPLDENSESGICKNPFQDLIIGWDGKVKCCSLDYNSEIVFGDVYKQSIKEIWNGQIRKIFLKKVYNKEYKNISVCKDCKSPYFSKLKERKKINDFNNTTT